MGTLRFCTMRAAQLKHKVSPLCSASEAARAAPVEMTSLWWCNRSSITVTLSSRAQSRNLVFLHYARSATEPQGLSTAQLRMAD
jgi:hypothetical protein